MTKKDYILLANIIKSNSRFADLRGEKTSMLHRSNFMFDLCKMLKNDNSNFNEIKFREASGEILSNK